MYCKDPQAATLVEQNDLPQKKRFHWTILNRLKLPPSWFSHAKFLRSNTFFFQILVQQIRFSWLVWRSMTMTIIFKLKIGGLWVITLARRWITSLLRFVYLGVADDDLEGENPLKRWHAENSSSTYQIINFQGISFRERNSPHLREKKWQLTRWFDHSINSCQTQVEQANHTPSMFLSTSSPKTCFTFHPNPSNSPWMDFFSPLRC